MKLVRLLLFISAILVLQTQLNAQQERISGVVVDMKDTPLQFASIYMEELLTTVSSDENGNFSLVVPKNYNEIHLRITMVGKKTEQLVIKRGQFSRVLRIKMEELSYTLKEITVNPILQNTINSNSSIVFDEEAIERIQAFSLMDILNTIPGKATVAPNIDKPQMLNLRGNQEGNYALNNSLGIAIVVDGVNLSNDANMQTRSLSQFSMGGGALSGAKSYTGGDVPFQGIDLRDIPVETIEKVEIIQGVASAQFSELTDGAILIDRKAAKTPWSFVTNVNGGSTNFSLSKGVELSKKAGALNLAVNYAISNPDPRDKVKQFNRLSTSAMWSKNFTKKLRNTLSLDFNKKIDQVKQDPDDETEQLSYSRDYGLRISNRLNLRTESSFAKNINLTFSYSQGQQHSYKQWKLNQSPKGYSYKDTTGIYEGVLLSGRYIAEEEISGKPVTGSMNLNANAHVYTGDVLHVLSYGFSGNYSNNGGKGIIADPDKPRWINQGGQNARPYSFEYLDPLINYGFFVSDNFSVKVGERKLISNLGMRLDQQNGSWSVQPRLSTVLKWNRNLDFTAAFGVSSKSPTMAHRYPAPTFLDIPLILAYNSDASLYLVYTEKMIADNSHLKPSKSMQAEVGVRYQHPWFSSSLTAYWKNNTDGFSTVKKYKQTTLPEYTYYFDAVQKKMIYDQTGGFVNFYGYGDYRMDNLLNLMTYGLDWMVNVKKIEPIHTSLNFSTSVMVSQERPRGTDIVSLSEGIDIQGEKIWYVLFPPSSYDTKLNVMSKLGTTTHIPRLGFIVMANFDLFWTRRTRSKYGDKIQQSTFYQDLAGNAKPYPADFEKIPVRDLSLSKNNQPFIYGCLNLSVAKELKKRFRIAVTAYNVLNIQPENLIYSPTNVESFTVEKFNAPLSITGGISFKF